MDSPDNQDNTCCFRCELCAVDLEQTPEQHCSTLEHQRAMNAVEKMQKDASAFDCIMLQIRIQGLGLPQWRTAVEALVYREFYVSWLDVRNSYNTGNAVKELCRFERMEQTSLLELAVWKAMCIATFPVDQQRGYHEFYEWIRNGWKAAKSSQRRCNEIAIVIGGVRLFL